MKILHVLDHSLPLHSGYTFRTAAILSHQRKLGWTTVQLTSPRQGQCSKFSEESDGFVFYRTPYTPGALTKIPGFWPFFEMHATRRRLHELARSERPDLIHAHSPALDAWPAIRVGSELGIPVVYEVRAFWEDAAVDIGSAREGGSRYRLTRLMETMALRSADAVTTICEGLRQDILARGIDQDKVAVIPNAVDVERFPVLDKKDSRLERELGLAGYDVLGFCGSFYAYEGLDTLIAAMPGIIAKRPATKLLLVGGGPQSAALEAQVAAMGLGERVVFTGRVPNASIDRYYSVVDLLVYPRRRIRLTDLVTPLKPLEAMAQGRLVAASDIGGHRELIEPGITGVLFAPDDPAALSACVVAVLDDEAGKRRMLLGGRRFVENERNWTASVSRYEAVYRHAIARKARSAAKAVG